MIKIYLSIFIVLFTLQKVNAQEFDLQKIYDLVQKRTSEEISLPDVKLIIDGFDREIQADEYLEKMMVVRGDDVGNGGDQITDTLIQMATVSLNFLSQQYGEKYTFSNGKTISFASLKNSLIARDILVVDEISVGEVSVNYIVVKGKIILKKTFFQTALKDKKDLRQKGLNLILMKNGINDESELNSLELYSLLNPLGGVPVCESMVGSQSMTLVPRVLEFSNRKSIDGLVEQAIMSCKEEGLVECKEVNSGYRGFAKWAKYHVTVSGLEMTISGASLCEQAKNCFELYQIAPVGQIGEKEMEKQSQMVIDSCH